MNNTNQHNTFLHNRREGVVNRLNNGGKRYRTHGQVEGVQSRDLRERRTNVDPQSASDIGKLAALGLGVALSAAAISGAERISADKDPVVAGVTAELNAIPGAQDTFEDWQAENATISPVPSEFDK